MVKIITDFSHVADSDLAVKAQQIIDSMTDNEHFATPVPALADVQTALTDYNTALSQTVSGGKEFTVIKNQKRAALVALLSALANYVQNNCRDDAAMAISSGFSLAKTRVPVGVLARPEKFKAVADRPGEIALQVHSVNHAVGYVWQYKTADDADWKEAHSTKAKIVLTGLASGIQYTCRVAGMGTNPSQTWSITISLYVQ